MRFYKAYIKADPLEDPEVVQDLYLRLVNQKITPTITDMPWQDIDNGGDPFLYFRNPYIRVDDELWLLGMHFDNPFFPFITTSNEEVVSVNPASQDKVPYVLSRQASYFVPKQEPLPILLGTHRRPLYLRLTLNSLLHSTQHIPQQKIYIVASNPDEATLDILSEYQSKHDSLEVVATVTNTRYALIQFGAKFFRLEKFIHFEDDGILPESTAHLLPFWTQQLRHRAQTADLVGFRISEQNRNTQLHRHAEQRPKDYCQLAFDDNQLWNYFKVQPNQLPAISGLGLVIDSKTMYKDFGEYYFKTDISLHRQADSLCVVNHPIYHIGANSVMDFEPNPSSSGTEVVARFHKGANLRTGETRKIDLAVDWEDHP